jgi:hypothetical protein
VSSHETRTNLISQTIYIILQKVNLNLQKMNEIRLHIYNIVNIYIYGGF